MQPSIIIILHDNQDLKERASQNMKVLLDTLNEFAPTYSLHTHTAKMGIFSLHTIYNWRIALSTLVQWAQSGYFDLLYMSSPNVLTFVSDELTLDNPHHGDISDVVVNRVVNKPITRHATWSVWL